MIYGLVRFAHYEWSYAPWTARNAGIIFIIMVVGSIVGHGAFAWWWIDNNIGQCEGKLYHGVMGPDTSELGFWSAVVCQAYLSAASLCQIVTRQHTGGVSWTIWALRALGSILGFYVPYAWQWYFWNEAHQYVMSPFAIFLWGTSVVCDFVYPFARWQALQAEQLLPDGRKVNRHIVAAIGGKSRSKLSWKQLAEPIQRAWTYLIKTPYISMSQEHALC